MKQLLSAIIILISSLLAGCSNDNKTALQQVQETGELHVISRNGPTTYYEGSQGPAGLEYELLSRFSEYLGVTLKLEAFESFPDILPAVIKNKADFAAAGITITEERKKIVRFSSPYQSINSQVVYLGGKKRPKTIADLSGKKISVVANSSQEEILQQLKTKIPDLSWDAVSNESMDAQFKRILSGEIDYMIGDSNDIAINRRYYPKIRIGFNISDSEQLAWVFPPGTDDSLLTKANDFLQDLAETGDLEYLVERYYGYINRLNFVDKRTFFQHTETRLPEFEKDFKKASEKTGYDWHILAAIGYQESHWNPKAKSPTGVRGIMMLTQGTAKQMGVTDRLSASQSIMGGARYLKRVEKKIPKRIKEPDRLWFALAGYNVGFGHLEDARRLTQKRGDNPDKWLDVKKHLPDLSKPEVYKTLRYGYARGEEPVNYVDNIRNFYDLLLWQEQRQQAEENSAPEGLFSELTKLFN